MNESREIWSLPWHALQRNLAKRIRAEAVADYAATVKVQRVTLAASSWLGRSRRRVEPTPSL